MHRDTAGQEQYYSITEQYFRRAQGILLVYDITNQKSFDDLQMWTEKLKQVYATVCCKDIAACQFYIRNWILKHQLYYWVTRLI